MLGNIITIIDKTFSKKSIYDNPKVVIQFILKKLFY